MSVRGAASLGIGAMVGAGIFALLGQAGAVAGAATWLSFLLGGVVATLLGYVVAKLGARYPSSGGLVTYLTEGFGVGHLVGTFAWLLYFAAIIITAMVAVSFGSYATALFIGEGASAISGDLFTAGVIIVVAAVQILGADAIAKVQSLIVVILMAVFAVFIVVTLGQMDAELLSPSLYPPAFDIVSSIALTFFAYLGFAVISYAGEDLPNPARNLPKATYIALGITTALYILISIGVFGTLTVEQVIGYGETALAEAARPVLGDAGFAMMAVAALLATFTSVNANVYGVVGLTSALARNGQFPPKFGQPGRFGKHRGHGCLGDFRPTPRPSGRPDRDRVTGERGGPGDFPHGGSRRNEASSRDRVEPGVIILAIASTAIVLVVFGIQTWQDAPETFVAMVVVLGLAVALELIWSAVRRGRQTTTTSGVDGKGCACDPEEVRSRAKALMPELIEDLVELVSHASCSFPGYPEEPVHEMRRASMELLERHGAEVRELDLGEGKPAIYGDMRRAGRGADRPALRPLRRAARPGRGRLGHRSLASRDQGWPPLRTGGGGRQERSDHPRRHPRRLRRRPPGQPPDPHRRRGGDSQPHRSLRRRPSRRCSRPTPM